MTNVPEIPIYVSKASFKSLGQEYSVYSDRVELRFRFFFMKFVIPVDEIIEVEIRPPFAFADIFRGKKFRASMAMKLDLADFYTHVSIHRKSKLLPYLRFTPDNPGLFVEACKSIMK